MTNRRKKMFQRINRGIKYWIWKILKYCEISDCMDESNADLHGKTDERV